MQKIIKKISAISLTPAAVLLATTFSVQADINMSLHNACENAKQQTKSVEKASDNSSQSAYKLKLANYYAGVSCQGKSLIHTSLNDKTKGESLADAHLLNRS